MQLIRGFLFCCFSLLTLILTAGTSAVTDEVGREVFDLKNAPAVIDRLAAPDKALSSDPKIALKWWKASGRIWSPAKGCRSDYHGLDSALEDAGITIWLRLVTDRSGECKDVSAEANLNITFRDRASLSGFRAMLEKRFGIADASCSDARVAYWHVAKGSSLRWREHGNTVVLDLLASEPTEPACTINSVPGQKLFDEAALTALFKRFKDDPPPWKDRDKLLKWLSAYGQLFPENKNSCLDSYKIKPVFSGFMISSWIAESCTAEEQALLAKAPTIIDPTHSGVFFHAEPWVKFSMKDIESKMTEYYGNPAPCSHETLKIWITSNNDFLILPASDKEIIFIFQTNPDIHDLCTN